MSSADDQPIQKVDAALDALIARATEMVFGADRFLVPGRVLVSVRGGATTLDGAVDHLRAKELAFLLSGQIRGVRSLKDQVELIPLTRRDDEILRDATRILAADPAIRRLKIRLAINRGVLALRGTVRSWGQKRLAEWLVSATPGLQKINNLIEISEVSFRGALEIATDIRNRIAYDTWLSKYPILVSVSEGRASLRGFVNCLVEKSRAVELAYVAGVREVEADDLRVDWYTHKPFVRSPLPQAEIDAGAEQALREALFYDPRVADESLVVTVSRGHATIQGLVNTLKAKQGVQQAAEMVEGITKIDNKVAVRPMKNTDISPPELIAAHQMLRGTDLRMFLNRGRAVLTGTVETEYQRSVVVDLASRLAGVGEVLDRVKVRLPDRRYADSDLASRVRLLLFTDPFLPPGARVGVKTENGLVRLTGDVGGPNEQRLAARDAFRGGATAVQNDLRVRMGAPLQGKHFVVSPIPLNETGSSNVMAMLR